jgi:hypothetical protein
MQAVKRVGDGDGRMASEYRKIAQNEMDKCKETIPVWIMPLDRVIEKLRISENLFYSFDCNIENMKIVIDELNDLILEVELLCSKTI